MKEKYAQNKTELIQFRLDKDSKILAKALADKYFDGKMSAMFRYLLHNNNLEKINDIEDKTLTHSTAMSQEAVGWLDTIHGDYQDENGELSAIGNNVNQIAHQVNARALSGLNPLTKQTQEDIKSMKESLHSLRIQSAARWKKVKAIIGNHSSNQNT